MLFNSFAFILVFLPVVFAGFQIIGRVDRRAAAAWLALASLFFYGWWNPFYVGLLLASIGANFGASRVLHALHAGRRVRALRAGLALAVGANLALLAYYKYANFFVATVDALSGAQFALADIVLPLGISFFTFTQIAFLVDTARGEASEPSFVHYTLFVTYFPHLIAGPILHHREMMPQFADPAVYRLRGDDIAVGLSYFAIGLAKKTLIADSMSPDVGAVFAPGTAAPALLPAWHAALAYTFQIYFDFSGYSDMAVGLSRMFGIRLPYNFDSPYRSTSIIDFWRRWHMTLSRFLRDYLYIALGGNRRGRARRYLNLFATMLLGGLWHGANWTFVAWGALHGAFLVINHAWRGATAGVHLPAHLRPAARCAGAVVTFLAVVVAWVFFRAPDFSVAAGVLRGMAGLNGLGAFAPGSAGNLGPFAAVLGVGGETTAMLKFVAAASIAFALPSSQRILEPRAASRDDAAELPVLALRWRPGAAWAVAMGVAMACAMLSFARVSEFLYFQF
ncbi:MAG: MBOAT family protein [Gammaproteobacteria bacterium]